MKNSYSKKLLTLGAGLLMACSVSNAQSITENFDDITLLAGNGWNMQNLSTPIGTVPNWFQGNATTFASFNGATNSYIGANYNFVAGANTISGWLITPNVTLRNGDVFSFYTRCYANPNTWPDRLEVRMSTNGASTNVGTTNTSVGDFTTVLLTINPTLITTGYPGVWTQYTITISGLPAPTSGRLAFRYFVTNGGPSGANSDYIGIDAFQYTPYVCPPFTMGPGALAGGTAGVAYSDAVTSTGPLGAPTYSVTAGALPPGLTLNSGTGAITGTPTATGTFNFTITVNDNSGCSGSTAYSITIVCPTNGATMSSIPPLCSNGSPYMLIEGSPAGGTYSGTNVSGGMFDPSGGTQTITYTVIDAYGCTQVTSGTATVNTAPTVSVQPFTAVCDNAGAQTLGGESPAGGVWSGTMVTGNSFDPSMGTQAITYTFTDANGCSDAVTQNFDVNTSPTVTFQPLSPVCDNSGMITLGGESPAGGTFSGTGVTGNQFDASVGTQTIDYTYTDANGCSNSASQTQTVNTAPTVTLSFSMDTLCQSVGTITLSGESPAGGTWSGPGVTGNQFDPMTSGTGMITVTYMYTDANSCSGTAMDSILVDICLDVTAPVNAVSFGMYPNPASENVTITVSEGNSIVRIMNVNGQVLNSVFVNTNVTIIDLAGFAAGVYVVEVENNGVTSHQRLIIQ